MWVTSRSFAVRSALLGRPASWSRPRRQRTHQIRLRDSRWIRCPRRAVRWQRPRTCRPMANSGCSWGFVVRASDGVHAHECHPFLMIPSVSRNAPKRTSDPPTTTCQHAFQVRLVEGKSRSRRQIRWCWTKRKSNSFRSPQEFGRKLDDFQSTLESVYGMKIRPGRSGSRLIELYPSRLADAA